MAEKDVYITGEVLDLFWDCLDEDILDNEFQFPVSTRLQKYQLIATYLVGKYIFKL